MLAVLLLGAAEPSPFAWVDRQGKLRVSDSKKTYERPGVREPDRLGDVVVYWLDGTTCTLMWRNLKTGATRVLRRANLRSPRLSPDGTLVAFTEYVGNRWRIFTIPSQGGKPTEVGATWKKDVFQPVWQPSPDIWAQDMSSAVRINGKTGAVVGSLSFSTMVGAGASSGDTAFRAPDGSLYWNSETEKVDKRVVDETTGTGSALYVRDAKGTRRITPPTVSVGTFRWRNGWIVFAGTAIWGSQALSGVYKMRADGTGLAFVAMGNEPG